MPGNDSQSQLPLPPFLSPSPFLHLSFSLTPTPSVESPYIFQDDLELLGSTDPPTSDYQGARSTDNISVLGLKPNLIQSLVQLEAMILSRLIIKFI